MKNHGEMFGAHGRVFKMTFYEESARVPFIIRWPGHVPAGAVSDACMSTPDIMPTVLGLCGQKIPAAVEGMNLSHLALAWCADCTQGERTKTVFHRDAPLSPLARPALRVD
jgi:arylsulfatase A-like enzyme